MGTTIDASTNKGSLNLADKLPIGDGSGLPKHYTVQQIVDAASTSTDSNGSIAGIASGISIQEIGGAALHKTVFTFTNVSLTLTNDIGVGAYGSAKIYTMPKGFIQLGHVNNLTITKSSAGVSDTWSGAVGLGNAAASTGGLTAPEDTFWDVATGSQPIGPAVAGVQSDKAFVSAAPAIGQLDASTTGGNATVMYLNMAVADADETVAITPCNLIVDGTITLFWSNVGDF